MHVVKTFAEMATYHSGQQFVRPVNNNFETSHHTNDEIKAGLYGELGDQFKLWTEVVITTPSEQDKIRYENFTMGYFYRHDIQPPGEDADHSVYFKWDRINGNLQGRVFVYPLSVEHISTLDPGLPKSLVADADASDPPSSTTPPPPLNGVGSSA